MCLPKSRKDGSHLEEWETSHGSTDGSFADQISVVWVQKGRTPSRPAGAAAEGLLGFAAMEVSFTHLHPRDTDRNRRDCYFHDLEREVEKVCVGWCVCVLDDIRHETAVLVRTNSKAIFIQFFSDNFPPPTGVTSSTPLTRFASST